MDSPEHRRRRKPISRLFSVRSVLLFFGVLSFLLFLNSWSLKPLLVPSRSDSTRNYGNFLHLNSIQHLILLPDHVLLLLNAHEVFDEFPQLDCVYGKNSEISSGIIKRKVISIDNYDDFRIVVRCPLPPENFSASVHLISRKDEEIQRFLEEAADNGLGMDFNHSVYSWKKLAYAASIDRNTIVVFAKGLNTRSGRESDPGPYSCDFRFRDTKAATTRAISVAQEVVRCFLPPSLKNSTKEGEEIRVAISVMRCVNGQARKRVALPSIARVFNAKIDEKTVKYDVCVCTMVWNQANMIKEWIMYHAWLGVEKWFIYDNNSDDEIKEIINELKDYNVTRYLWPWIKTQEAGFSHCVLRAKYECNWVAFMDVDEFFYFPGHSRRRRWRYAAKNGLRALVANYSSRIGEIRTNCYSFGPSGLTSVPPHGVTTGYTCRIHSPERHKSIVRPSALNNNLLNVVHHFRLRNGFRSLNMPMNKVVINHYKYQVWDVFKAKFYRRVATYVADWQENHKEGSRDRVPGLGTEPIEPTNWSRRFCEVWDTGMHDFVLTNLVNRSSGLLPWELASNQL